VDVQETGYRRCKVAQWSDRVAGDFGKLARCGNPFVRLATQNTATSFAVALVPGCDRSWTHWNTWSRRGAGTYGRDLPAEISQ
jgi:hypothetical protein